jgi:hypothetical protein
LQSQAAAHYGNFSHKWSGFCNSDAKPYSVRLFTIDNQMEQAMKQVRSRIYTKKHIVAERVAEIFLVSILLVGVISFLL